MRQGVGWASAATTATREQAGQRPRTLIDLHSHILPGVDDGPSDIDGSIDLARAAELDGVTTMAATPHVRADHPGVRPAELPDRCVELNERLAAAGVGLTVVPGGEVDLLWAQGAADDDLRLVSYGQRGTDLLVETPYGPLPPRFEDVLFRLAVLGYRVLLAHPERNPSFQRSPERIEELVRRGVLVQLTALSLARQDKRSRSRRLALTLVERGLAHVIASDAHSASWRQPDLSAGVAAAARVAGARAHWMVTEAPAAILAGDALPPAPTQAAARRRRLLPWGS